MKQFVLSLLLITMFHFHLPLVSAHELLPEDVLKILQNDPDLQSDAARELIDEHLNSGTPEQQRQVQEIFRQQSISVEQGFWNSFIRFILLGIQHILEGLDHILFVLSLILVFVSLRNVFVLVSAFTISHSVTLILAGTSVFSLSARVVEPLIALSIAVVAAGSVYFSKSLWWKGARKAWIVFFFGLFHGLGFAGLLEGLQVPSDRFLSSLLAFNIGIELGQILVLAIALPGVYLFRKKSWYPTFIRVVAVVITLIALYWFVERVFF